ncbi:hypothetical protein IW21_08940 [Campylobacter fetus subsp. venerealis]|nr:hypothetical protein IW21_08940 [Campylobacter fetus subsp. venerealis]PHJ03840.1 hypothetical protein IW23_09125 [Campylobacter fetus subsp. venerealis]
MKNLSKNELSRNIMSIEKSQVDMNTGEVVSKENVLIKRFIKQDDFIQFFVENIAFVNTQLDSSEKSVLFAVIAKMDYGNIITINASTRKTLIGRTGLSKATISRGINGLIDKKVLLFLDTEELKKKYMVYDDSSYLVNPNIVGKGSFRELKRLRQMVVTDFDFDKMEAKQEVIRETAYEDFETIKQNKDNYQVKSLQHNVSEDKKIQNFDIIIEKKDINAQLPLFDENQKEQNARLFVEKFGGMFSGAFHPTKSAKEMKRELLDQDLKESKI